MSGPVYVSRASAKNTRLRKENERLKKENDLLRLELARVFEEREGKACEVTIVGEKIDYQLVLPLDS